MKRRELLKLAAATALTAPLGLRAAQTQNATLKIGVVGPKTGPLAPGAAVTHFPNFKLWANEVNDRGGLKLKGGQRKVELIEYDDRTQPPETIKAVERLATVDKADFIMPVYAHRLQSRGRAGVRQVQLSAGHAGLRHRSDRHADQALSQLVHRPGLDHGLRHVGDQRAEEAQGRQARSATRSRS